MRSVPEAPDPTRSGVCFIPIGLDEVEETGTDEAESRILPFPESLLRMDDSYLSTPQAVYCRSTVTTVNCCCHCRSRYPHSKARIHVVALLLLSHIGGRLNEPLQIMTMPCFGLRDHLSSFLLSAETTGHWAGAYPALSLFFCLDVFREV